MPPLGVSPFVRVNNHDLLNFKIEWIDQNIKMRTHLSTNSSHNGLKSKKYSPISNIYKYPDIVLSMHTILNKYIP